MATERELRRLPRILIACERSAVVSTAFEAKGFYVVSCDILPRESAGIHYQGNVMDILDDGWDCIIGFPPCTFLCKAQLHMQDYERKINRLKAIEFFKNIMHADCPLIALENPIGILSSAFRAPDQITSPHYFGSLYSKDVCLWLKGLPPLIDTYVSAGRKKVRNHVNSKMTQEQKSQIKSRFFPEMAREMANQWSRYIWEAADIRSRNQEMRMSSVRAMSRYAICSN